MVMLSRFVRTAIVLGAAVVLASCAATYEDPERVELGNFKLGYVIVVGDNAQQAPLSRPATADELEAALKPDIERLLQGYEGDKFYHVAVHVDGYSLAVPGIPIVASPKSALIVSINVWDDAAGTKLLEESVQLTVLEKFSGDSIVGSGLTKNAEEQLTGLSQATAKKIYEWLVENKHLFDATTDEPT